MGKKDKRVGATNYVPLNTLSLRDKIERDKSLLNKEPKFAISVETQKERAALKKRFRDSDLRDRMEKSTQLDRKLSKNASKRSKSEELIRWAMDDYNLSRDEAIKFIKSNKSSSEAEKGDQKLMNMTTEPKGQEIASGGSVKKSYAYGGRVAQYSAEKS